MNILLLHALQPTAATVSDHLNAFGKYSSYNFVTKNILKEAPLLSSMNQFDFIIIHYTICMFREYFFPLWLVTCLKKTKAKKIVFIQDEYRQVNKIIDALSQIKADILFTCVPENEIEKVYPKTKLPNLTKINTLTGYVPKKILKEARPSYKDRALDIMYRARKLSAWYGSLAQEKWQIADKFEKDAKAYGLSYDLSYLEEDRIYGDKWISFLKNTKAVLGTESGASIFDFTGEIQKQVEAYEKENPEASFEEIQEKFFKGLDGKIKLNQISPRCFESAALGTLMVLYEGNYSGVLKPWRHYVPLKKDHSNMDEVVKYIKDKKLWKKITDTAYKEVALNSKYGYKGFINQFDTVIKPFSENQKETKKITSIKTIKVDNSLYNSYFVYSKLIAKVVKAFQISFLLVKNTVFLPISFLLKMFAKTACLFKPILSPLTTKIYPFSFQLKIAFEPQKILRHLVRKFFKCKMFLKDYFLFLVWLPKIKISYILMPFYYDIKKIIFIKNYISSLNLMYQLTEGDFLVVLKNINKDELNILFDADKIDRNIVQSKDLKKKIKECKKINFAYVDKDHISESIRGKNVTLSKKDGLIKELVLETLF